MQQEKTILINTYPKPFHLLSCTNSSSDEFFMQNLSDGLHANFVSYLSVLAYNFNQVLEFVCMFQYPCLSWLALVQYILLKMEILHCICTALFQNIIGVSPNTFSIDITRCGHNEVKNYHLLTSLQSKNK